jgi:3-oxoacyl-[acyl-carrier protein] reductase
MHNVIVTGASRGVGLGIAGRLCACGYRVIAVARRETDALLSTRKDVASKGVASLDFRAFDLSDIAEIPKFAKTIEEEFGQIYGLVNNAATGTSGILASLQNKKIEYTVRMNTLSPILLTKYVVRAMMGAGGGRIVNIASIISATGISGLSVYGATKASLVGFTRSLAREVGPLNINVNAVAPGFIDSDMTREMSPHQREQILRRSPLRRFAETRDIAGAVEFLLGEQARNITGTVLTIDAGSTA